MIADENDTIVFENGKMMAKIPVNYVGVNYE